LSVEVDSRAARFPWVTLGVTGLALAAWAWPEALAWGGLDRARVLRGELWRLWSAHLVHFGGSHLLWNLAVLAPAGVLAERSAPRETRVLYGLGAPAIGLVLLGLEPQMAVYAGLSGIATALLTLLCVVKLGEPARGDRWFWGALLALVALKTGGEFLARGPLFASLAGEVRPVPLAHVAGVACALALAWYQRRRGPAAR
jgi:rhomboid family GlyGly-CTERM serine protease